MILFFNEAATDPASALVRSLTNNQAGPRPCFTLGDNPEVEIHISDGAAGYSSRSGDATITPWLGIGTPGASPSGGTFWLGVSSATSGSLTNAKRYQIQTYVAGDDFTNCGAAENASGVIFTKINGSPTDWSNGSTLIEITTDIAYSASAATLEAALEATDAITGVSVTKSGTAPVFVIEWDAVGAQSALIGGPSNLTPASAAVTSELRAGSASETEKQLVRLTRQPYALQTVWSDEGDYWKARLDCNTRGLLELLDGAASIGSTLELQLIDGDGNISTLAQTACLIRNEAIDEESTIPAPFPSYPTNALVLLECVQNRFAVTALTGGGTALDGIATGTIAGPTVQTNSMVCIEIAAALSFYELVTGTDATSSPDVIRPADYATTTNERVWKLRSISDATKLPFAGGTMTGQINFSGTTHAGIKLISLTTTQRNALTAANGMLIYNSTLSKVQRYEAGAWSDIDDGGTPAAHAATHQNGGGDEIATATPSANAIPKADSSGKLASGWIPTGGGLSLYSENPTSPTPPVASGANAVAVGHGATASGGNAFSAMGFAAGNGSRAFFGGTASGTYSEARGIGAMADKWGQSANSACSFGTLGDAQSWQAIMLAATSDATGTELFLDLPTSGSHRVVLANNSTYAFSGRITARRTDASENDGWEVKGLIHRDASAASTVLDALQLNQLGSTSWGVSVTADTTNGSLKVIVTGQAAKNIRWCISLDVTEVKA